MNLIWEKVVGEDTMDNKQMDALKPMRGMIRPSNGGHCEFYDGEKWIEINIRNDDYQVFPYLDHPFCEDEKDYTDIGLHWGSLEKYNKELNGYIISDTDYRLFRNFTDTNISIYKDLESFTDPTWEVKFISTESRLYIIGRVTYSLEQAKLIGEKIYIDSIKENSMLRKYIDYLESADK
jgi:hypothetical protein